MQASNIPFVKTWKPTAVIQQPQIIRKFLSDNKWHRHDLGDVQKFLEQYPEMLTMLEESNTLDYIKKVFFHLSHHLNSEQAAHGQEEDICKTDTPRFTVTCFTVLCRYSLLIFFYKGKFYGNPDTSKMVGIIFFSNSICSLGVSGSLLIDFYSISTFYYYMCFDDLWAVMFGVTISKIITAY